MFTAFPSRPSFSQDNDDDDDDDEATIDLISSATNYLVIDEHLSPASCNDPCNVTPQPPTPRVKKKPHVHVECCLKPETTEPFENVKHVVRKHIKNCKAALFTHSEITFDFADESAIYLSEHVERLRVCEAGGDSSDVYALKDIDLHVHVYQLQEEGAVEEVSEEENVLMANHWMLPSTELEGLWESLIYDNDLQLKLLDYVSTTMLFSDCHVDPNIISWNRVVLLYGPPGTGKTSLCRALAQKLSIRLADKYTYGKLVEINSHSLFSKWFSESGKLVQRMFQQIRDLIENEDAFVCVLIDEVESLAAARKSAALGTEPSDAIRVVNALLTQIDQLKQRRNVLILTTSNISQAIDVAFVDRADIKQFVGLPSQKAVYSILSSCICELSRVGIIRNHSPLLDWRAVHLFRDVDNTSSDPSRKLYEIAGKCQGMSGRCLRKLPFLTHAFHLRSSACTLEEFLVALDRTVEEEEEGQRRLENF